MIYKYIIKDYGGDEDDFSGGRQWAYSLVMKGNDITKPKWKLWSLCRTHAYYFDEYESDEFYQLCKELNLTIIDEKEYYGTR